MATPLSCQEAAQIVNMRVRDHESTAAIALALGRHETTVGNVLRACGLIKRPLTPEQRRVRNDRIVALARDGKSVNRIAQCVRLTAFSVHKILEERGVHDHPFTTFADDPERCDRCGMLLKSAPSAEVDWLCSLCVAELRAGERCQRDELSTAEIAKVLAACAHHERVAA